MLSADMTTLWKGTQFMTERAGGSDVGAIETVARRDGDVWRLHGDKWFCSHVDADVALILARPEGAPAGTKGLALFALPRRLKDGRRNSDRIAPSLVPARWQAARSVSRERLPIWSATSRAGSSR
jgi:alkylation response protein AidB-like acyl-CoA dehydrogenase